MISSNKIRFEVLNIPSPKSKKDEEGTNNVDDAKGEKDPAVFPIIFSIDNSLNVVNVVNLSGKGDHLSGEYDKVSHFIDLDLFNIKSILVENMCVNVTLFQGELTNIFQNYIQNGSDKFKLIINLSKDNGDNRKESFLFYDCGSDDPNEENVTPTLLIEKEKPTKYSFESSEYVLDKKSITQPNTIDNVITYKKYNFAIYRGHSGDDFEIILDTYNHFEKDLFIPTSI